MPKSRRARQREARRRKEEAAATLPVDDQARGEDHREQDCAEEEEEPSQEKAYDPEQPLPNLGTHFAVLTNAVLKRITDAKTSDRMYDDFMRGAKTSLMKDLSETYCKLLNFYNDPALTMPSWLAQSPCVKSFYTPDMDVRLQSRESQVIEDLREFVKEQGFFCTGLRAYNSSFGGGGVFYHVGLRLDVATGSTAEASKHVEKRLRNLKYDFNV